MSKLRVDADLRYLYTGPQKPKGRPCKYDGKVDLRDLSRFTLVEAIEPGLHLYTTLVWHVSLKRKIRLALLVDTRKAGKTGYVPLFSTDVELDAKTMLDYYKARFQIEILQLQCPDKSEGIDDEVASMLVVFRETSEHSLKAWKGISRGLFQWAVS